MLHTLKTTPPPQKKNGFQDLLQSGLIFKTVIIIPLRQISTLSVEKRRKERLLSPRPLFFFTNRVDISAPLRTAQSAVPNADVGGGRGRRILCPHGNVTELSVLRTQKNLEDPIRTVVHLQPETLFWPRCSQYRQASLYTCCP